MARVERNKCKYDEIGFHACLNCSMSDCIRDDILDDEFIEEPPKEKDNTDDIYDHHSRKRRWARYKGTYFDDELHRKAREYEWKKRRGLLVPKTEFKVKGRELEYQREYRANMPDEQRERYRAWQREYARKKRAREKETA